MGELPVASLSTCNKTEPCPSQVTNQIANFPWHTVITISSGLLIATWNAHVSPGAGALLVRFGAGALGEGVGRVEDDFFVGIEA